MNKTASTTKVKNIRVEGREWFDRRYGNSYFSARAYVNGKLVVIAPFQYGYGGQYLQEVTGILRAGGYLGDSDRFERSPPEISRYCRENGIDLSTSIVTMLKRDVVTFGEGEL